MRHAANRCFFLATALALLVGPVRAWAADPPALEVVAVMPLEADVEVDPTGLLTHFELRSDAPKDIRAGMGALVGSWRFEPPVDPDGKPDAVKARMRLVLRADAEGEQFRVSVDNVRFERPPITERLFERPSARITFGELGRPRYPREAFLSGGTATVLVALRLSPDGTVADAVVVQSALYDAKDTSNRARQALRLFERSTLAAARKWQFQVEAIGEPTLADLTFVVPVHYYRDAKREKVAELGQWRRIARTPRVPIPWLPVDAGRVEAGVADVGGSEPSPVAAPLRLLGKIAGKTL